MPPKAAYLMFETSPDLEFEYFLAQKLSMTVAAMRKQMSGEEFTGWGMYYSRKAQRAELANLRSA